MTEKNDEIDNEIEQIELEYLRIMNEIRDFPSYSHLGLVGITKDKIRTKFGGITNLKTKMDTKYSAEISKIFATINSVFKDEKSARNLIGKTQRYVITTAVAGAPADLNFLSAVKSYADKNNASIIIMPCESTTNSFETKTAIFDKEFSKADYFFVTEDSHLCANLSLCSIQVSASQVKPITGLARIGKRSGSYVFASPKQFLEYYPNGNIKGNNYAIMTPGACTKPQYFSETFVSKRLSYVAENDHSIGAIIVEICDDNHHFHFRQIQSAADGSFTDLGTQFNSDGTTETVSAIAVLGDIHGVNCDASALAVFSLDLARKGIKISSLFLHDLFDGKSINHHESTIGAAAKNSMHGKSSLKTEIEETAIVFLNLIQQIDPGKVFVVKSNHDEFLDRYLKEGRYLKDPENHYTALKLATAPFENEDILERALMKMSLKWTADRLAAYKDKITFLDRHSSCKIAGIELASHGDLGNNGARSSLNGLEITYGKCVVGHTHSAAIQRGVFRVGTMSKLEMDYNRGPSSWTHTNALVYNNGQVQLLNYMNGSYFV